MHLAARGERAEDAVAWEVYEEAGDRSEIDRLLLFAKASSQKMDILVEDSIAKPAVKFRPALLEHLHLLHIVL